MEPEVRAAGVVVEGVAALTNETLRRWVKGWCKGKKKDLPHISTWDTHLVTDMSELFKDQYDFNDDIGAWDTSSVTTMEGMFSVKDNLWLGDKCMIFDQDLGAWVPRSPTCLTCSRAVNRSKGRASAAGIPRQ